MSYPTWTIKGDLKKVGISGRDMVGDTGFEPVTSTV